MVKKGGLTTPDDQVGGSRTIPYGQWDILATLTVTQKLNIFFVFFFFLKKK
jgi:hypothetical protein